MTEQLGIPAAVHGDLANYATLRFMDAAGKRIWVQMSFCVRDEGYGGCLVEFQQSLVDASLVEKLVQDGQQEYLLRKIRQSQQGYGGRGSHPAGPYCETIRDQFALGVERSIVEAIVEDLVPFLRQNVVVTLETIGAHPLNKRWVYAWEPRVTLVTA